MVAGSRTKGCPGLRPGRWDCRMIGRYNSFRYLDALGSPNPGLIQSAGSSILAGIRHKTALLTKDHGVQCTRTFRYPILRQSPSVKFRSTRSGAGRASFAPRGGHPGGAHRARNTLASVLFPTCPQLGMYARRSIGLARAGVDGPHPLQQRRVGQGVGRRGAVPPGIIARLRNIQHAGHGRNRKAGLVRAHEPENPDASAANASRFGDSPGLAGEPGRHSRENVALHPQLLVLAPQPGQLVALGRAQAISFLLRRPALQHQQSFHAPRWHERVSDILLHGS